MISAAVFVPTVTLFSKFEKSWEHAIDLHTYFVDLAKV